MAVVYRTFNVAVSAGVMLLAACDSPSQPIELGWADDPLQPEGHRVVSISKAFGTTCALADSGLLRCWGENRFGEFGNGTMEGSAVPVLAAGGMKLTRVFGSVGTPQMCGLTADGTAYCWGYNLNGEVGDGSQENYRLAPVPVAGGHQFTEIASSYHTCGVTQMGEVLCWGAALGGQLGSGPDADHQLSPAPIASSHAYTQVTNGMQFSCALRTSGETDCWGFVIGLGSIPSAESVFVPTPVSGDRLFTRLSAGPEWVCALDAAGTPLCWGKSEPDEVLYQPAAIPSAIQFTELVSGPGSGACALADDGAAYCWVGLEKPREVPGRHRYIGLGRGEQGYCGFTEGGSGYCWILHANFEAGVKRWGITMPERLSAF